MLSDKIYTLEEIKNIIQDNKKYLEEKYYVDNFLLFGERTQIMCALTFMLLRPAYFQ